MVSFIKSKHREYINGGSPRKLKDLNKPEISLFQFFDGEGMICMTA